MAMKKIAQLTLLLAAVALVGCGGGDTAQSISKEMLANFGIMAGILEGITDEASAHAAVPKIEAVRASMRDIAKRAKLVKTNAAGEKELNETMGKQLPGLQSRMTKAMVRLSSKPELMQILEQPMTGMENDL